MHPIRMLVSLGISAVLGVSMGAAQERKIELVPVKFEGLSQEVLRQRGKVLVVDFWAGFCLPCRKALPSLIELQKKYADRGFEIITVSVDAPGDVDKVSAANAFLRQVKSPFLNLLLHEPAEAWMKKLDFVSLPCYYVFDRQGRWIRFGGVESDKGVNYDELEKVVVRLLNEK